MNRQFRSLGYEDSGVDSSKRYESNVGMFEIKKRLKRNTKAMSNVFMIVTRGILLGCIVGDLGSGLGGDIAGKKKKKFGLVLSFFDFFFCVFAGQFFS